GCNFKILNSNKNLCGPPTHRRPVCATRQIEAAEPEASQSEFDDETIETLVLTTEQSLDFLFATNFSISSNLLNINNTLVVETLVTIEVPVAIEVSVTKTPD
ncbi:23100_t:CDS:2, partial [Gigaspora margarita]